MTTLITKGDSGVYRKKRRIKNIKKTKNLSPERWKNLIKNIGNTKGLSTDRWKDLIAFKTFTSTSSSYNCETKDFM